MGITASLRGRPAGSPHMDSSGWRSSRRGCLRGSTGCCCKQRTDRVRIAGQGILRIRLGKYPPESHEKGGAEVGTEIRNHASGTIALRPGILLLFLFAFLRAIAATAGETPVPAAYYVGEALSGNPSLASMRERIRMKENAAIRAGAFDDPKAWIGLTNLPIETWSFRDEDMSGKEIGVSQMFPYPGKRKLKTDIVVREREQAGYDLEEMRGMLRSGVKMTYAELAAVRRPGGGGGGRRGWCAAPGTSFGTSWALRSSCTPSAGEASPTCSGDRSSRGRCARCCSCSRTGRRSCRSVSTPWRPCPRTGRSRIFWSSPSFPFPSGRRN